MTRPAARHKSPGQLGFGLVPEPMSRAGYCAPCNRNSVDILRHRASQTHRDKASSTQSSGPRGSHAYRTRFNSHAGDEATRYEPKSRVPRHGGHMSVRDMDRLLGIV